MKKQKRRVGRLSKTTSDTQPNKLMFFDTETLPKYITDDKALQILRLGIARYIHITSAFDITQDKEIVFYTGDELLDFIESNVSSKKALYVFAHNIGFDLMVTKLPYLMKSRGYDIRPYIRNQMMFIWSVKLKGGTVKFINTGNFTPYKLSKVAQDLGMEKLSVEFDTDNENELIEYCKMDVEIIKELVITLLKFLKENELGSFKMTIASTALNAYKRRFNDSLPYTHTDEQILEMEQKAYKGGRTECFKIGEFTNQKFSYADINSMYPYCMIGDKLPKRMIRMFTPTSMNQVIDLMEHRYMLVDATIKTDKPFFGVTYNQNNVTILNTDQRPSSSKLIFPVGEFRQYLHHSEFDYALHSGYIQKIHNIVIYEQADLFTDYVNFFTNMKIQAKESNNKTYYLMAKLFLNSLYGKFAQQYKWQEKLEDNPNYEFVCDFVMNSNTEKFHSEFIWFGEKWGSFSSGLVAHSCPIIAGAITAKARMLLWEYIENVEMENMYYTDTDSLIVNDKGFSKLTPFIHHTELGYLDLEKETDHLIINGCKDYKFGEQRVIKGIPKNAKEIKPNTYEYDQFEGMGQWQRRDMESEPLIYKMVKNKKTPYDKCKVNEDNTLEPYEITIKSM